MPKSILPEGGESQSKIFLGGISFRLLYACPRMPESHLKDGLFPSTIVPSGLTKSRIFAFHGYCSAWRCLRRLKSPKGPAKKIIMAVTLTTHPQIQQRADINLDLKGKCSLHAVNAFQCEEIQLYIVELGIFEG